jgi:hypothetical protein
MDRSYRDAANLVAKAKKGLARQKKEKKLSRLYNQAMKSFERGDWQEAIDKLQQVLDLEKRYKDAAAKLAAAQDELAKAEAERKKQKKLTVLYEQAVAAMSAKQWQEALDLLGQVQAMSPSYRSTKTLIAEARAEAAKIVWVPDLEDDFGDKSGGWAEYSDDEVRNWYENGKYHILVKKPNLASWSDQGNYSDFMLQVDAAQVSGPYGDYGLVFRAVDRRNFYWFKVSAYGNWGLWKMVDGKWEEIVGWTSSSAIKKVRGINVLKVIATASEISLCVNDVHLKTVTDSTFSAGEVGMVAATFEKPNVHVHFDNFKVWVPKSWLLDLEDDFSDKSGGWTEYSDDEIRKWYENGKYHILVKKPNWASWSDQGNYPDFMLQVDAAQVSGPYGEYGLVFRAVANDNFYHFKVSAYGNWGLWKMVDGKWEEIVGWTSSSAIKKGRGINVLKVIATASEISLCVNDVHLKTVTDSTFSAGKVGMMASTFEKPNAHVRFDNLKVWVPK